MRRFLSLLVPILIAQTLFAQGVSGMWLVYEGSDGSDIVVTLSPDGNGEAELSLTRRFEAVPYGEGSQFWGTFRSTDGYYFLVNGRKSEAIQLAQKDSTAVIVRHSEPTVSVTAQLDEAYSTRELSDYGDYKQQVVAQWKRDFPNNADVKKYKTVMERYFKDFYDDVFDVLLEGQFRILERTDSTIVLKNPDLELPPLIWRRIQ